MNHNRTVSGVNVGRLWGQIAILREELQAVLVLWEQGRVRPLVDTAYPFAEAAAAHRRPVSSPGRGDGTDHSPWCDGPQSVYGARRIRAGHDRRRGTPVVLGFTLGIIYLVLLLVFAVLSFRKGHWVLGLVGFIFPVLWIIGAILPSRYAHR
jgi:Zinc-binding dehydrogenase